MAHGLPGLLTRLKHYSMETNQNRQHFRNKNLIPAGMLPVARNNYQYNRTRVLFRLLRMIRFINEGSKEQRLLEQTLVSRLPLS